MNEVESMVMLSVLIPTYNWPCRQLVESLLCQWRAEDGECEIIVADDASPDEACREANRAMKELPGCTYIGLEKNMGRARIRNFLAEKARGEFLLFMDCDARVISSDFLHRYVEAARHAPVVCGGLLHPDRQPEGENVSLRYRYERAADLHRSAAERSLHPYDCFTTFCFLIRRELFLQIRFDESCLEYGYEDTLFGEQLKLREVPILHTDNPLMHIGLEDNVTFLRKTETALQSLCRLESGGRRFHSRLVKRYDSLRRFHLHHLLPPLHRLLSPVLRRNLLSSSPNLFVFACYKLGHYACLKKNSDYPQ